MVPVQPADRPPCGGVRCGGHGAGVEDGGLGISCILHDPGSTALQFLPHALRVVLIGLAAERVQPDRLFHGAQMVERADVAQSSADVNHLRVRTIQFPAWR